MLALFSGRTVVARGVGGGVEEISSKIKADCACSIVFSLWGTFRLLYLLSIYSFPFFFLGFFLPISG